MSSRCRNPEFRFFAATFTALAIFAVPAMAQDNSLPTEQSAPPFVAVTGLFPGSGKPPAESSAAKQYEGNPQEISEGKRLFEWYNCSGCHFHGGGGMGPPLMSNQWRYGGQLDQIFESISQGRPNGMPSWHTKIADAQIWELAAFVKSMATKSAANGAGQTMPQTPPPPAASPPVPKTSAPGVEATPPQ